MSKLAHSNDETMDWIEFKAAIENGNEDLIFDVLVRYRAENEELRRVLGKMVPHLSDKIARKVAGGGYPANLFAARNEAQALLA